MLAFLFLTAWLILERMAGRDAETSWAACGSNCADRAVCRSLDKSWKFSRS